MVLTVSRVKVSNDVINTIDQMIDNRSYFVHLYWSNIIGQTINFSYVNAGGFMNQKSFNDTAVNQ